jgi:hypothetical protein
MPFRGTWSGLITMSNMLQRGFVFLNFLIRLVIDPVPYVKG